MTRDAPVLIERRSGVDWITLNRPERLNALTSPGVHQLADHFQALQYDQTVRVVVLRGAGRAFCAGLDLHAAAAGDDDSGLMRLPDLIVSMRRCPQPVVALVQGAACGGGFALALAADIRIAGRSAQMNDAFIKLGLSGCELGMSYLLPRIVGTSVASELMLTGRFIDADRALQTGLVSTVVDDDELNAAGEELVNDMLAASPIGLQRTKEVLNRTASIHDLEAVMLLEQSVQLACMNEGDFAGRVQAFTDRHSS